jgi:glycosyltransferase 2 family protein
MKNLARAAAVAGLALAIVLFARHDVAAIVALLVAAGPGLVLAALFHIAPMLANARGWQRLLPKAPRPELRVVAWATWVRESVNGLLPVARIGGELVAYRIVRSHLSSGSDAAASLVADMALSVLSQATFALLGIALLYAIGTTSALGTQLFIGVATMIVLGAGFVLAQRAGALGALVGMLNELLAGRFDRAHVQARGFDDALRAVYDRRRDVAACFSWQLAGWLLGAGELWIALRFLGEPRGILDAVALEALIQAVSSVAFFVPAALGVQEMAFIVIGAALGLDAATALALATARRLRDAIVFFPGLLAWHRAERRIRDVESAAASRQS